MVKVQTHVGLVVCIGEIVNPACGIRKNVDDVGIDKVIKTAQLTVDSLAYDVSVVVNVCGIL